MFRCTGCAGAVLLKSAYCIGGENYSRIVIAIIDVVKTITMLLSLVFSGVFECYKQLMRRLTCDAQ